MSISSDFLLTLVSVCNYLRRSKATKEVMWFGCLIFANCLTYNIVNGFQWHLLDELKKMIRSWQPCEFFCVFCYSLPLVDSSRIQVYCIHQVAALFSAEVWDFWLLLVLECNVCLDAVASFQSAVRCLWELFWLYQYQWLLWVSFVCNLLCDSSVVCA